MRMDADQSEAVSLALNALSLLWWQVICTSVYTKTVSNKLLRHTEGY